MRLHKEERRVALLSWRGWVEYTETVQKIKIDVAGSPPRQLHHVFEAGKPALVCGNTDNITASSTGVVDSTTAPADRRSGAVRMSCDYGIPHKVSKQASLLPLAGTGWLVIRECSFI